MTLIDTKRNR